MRGRGQWDHSGEGILDDPRPGSEVGAWANSGSRSETGTWSCLEPGDDKCPVGSHLFLSGLRIAIYSHFGRTPNPFLPVAYNQSLFQYGV